MATWPENEVSVDGAIADAVLVYLFGDMLEPSLDYRRVASRIYA